MNKGMMVALIGVALIGGMFLVNGVFASQGRMGQFGPNYSPERHAKMTEAFANEDYDSWKNLMGSRGAARVVTRENFPKFTQMHNLMLAGKIEEANKIRQELGLGNGQRRMMGTQGQNKGGNFIDTNGDGICDHMQ